MKSLLILTTAVAALGALSDVPEETARGPVSGRGAAPGRVPSPRTPPGRTPGPRRGGPTEPGTPERGLIRKGAHRPPPPPLAASGPDRRGVGHEGRCRGP